MLNPVRFMQLFAALALVAPPVFAQHSDVEGSQDHPLISRYEGSFIINYIQRDFDAFRLPTGQALAEGAEWTFQSALDLEGRVTRIRYAAPEGRSSLEVFRNYRQALDAAGFELLWSCQNDECGQLDRVLPRMKEDRGTDLMGKNRRHLTAVARTPEMQAYTSLHVVENDVNWLNGRPVIQLDLVEVEPIETDLVMVNTEALAKDIDRTGHAAVYGIYFDVDEAVVKPESGPALDKIARLLRQQPDLAVYVVGHTDNTGTLAHNMDLSQRRAEAVVQKLVVKYGIAAIRLVPVGVGPAAPVATNDREEGRVLNRRVELVKQ